MIAPSQPVRILIVEDEALIAEELRDRLEKMGYRVLAHVDCAEDALRAARELRPDLVLMDIRLKGERDGISAAGEIHAELGLPIVYLTAHSDMATVRRARESSPFGFVLKPFHERDLFVAIEMAAQRHCVEKRLRESEARYAATLASIGDGVIATDVLGQVTYMNGVAEELTGWPLAEARGLGIDSVLTLVEESDHAPRPNPVRQALDSGRVVHCNGRLSLLDRSGRVRPFEDCAAPIQDSRGRLAGAVLAFRDASERRAAEAALEASHERLRRSEHLESIGRLASGVAHDFNNLLTIIQGSAELLQRRPPAESVRGELLDSIRGACARGVLLTSRLLATGRRGQRAPVVVDLNLLVGQLHVLLERLLPETMRVELGLEREPCPVEVDPGLIESALLNLATNARDAMGAGGRLRLETARVEVRAGGELPDIEGEVPPGRYVRLVAADTGMGMTSAVRARLFEPFFTTKPAGQGTGLGLASVKGIVRQSRGFLDVETAPGLGTTFRIYLPEVAVERLPRGGPGVAAGTHTGCERLLVVEDDLMVRGVTCRALELHGYRVQSVHDAEEAARLLGGECAIDLLVTDIGLPGKSGLELARELRRSVPHLPVLFLSGYSEEFPLAAGAFAGSRRLAKPFELKELARLVRELFDERGLQPGTEG